MKHQFVFILLLGRPFSIAMMVVYSSSPINKSPIFITECIPQSVNHSTYCQLLNDKLCVTHRIHVLPYLTASEQTSRVKVTAIRHIPQMPCQPTSPAGQIGVLIHILQCGVNTDTHYLMSARNGNHVHLKGLSRGKSGAGRFASIFTIVNCCIL